VFIHRCKDTTFLLIFKKNKKNVDEVVRFEFFEVRSIYFNWTQKAFNWNL